MGELMLLIQAHLDKYGVSRAEFARRAGTTPQTVQNWIARPNTLPEPQHLRGVAEVIGQPYRVVLNAALIDAGYSPRYITSAGEGSSHDSQTRLRGRIDDAAFGGFGEVDDADDRGDQAAGP